LKIAIGLSSVCLMMEASLRLNFVTLSVLLAIHSIHDNSALVLNLASNMALFKSMVNIVSYGIGFNPVAKNAALLSP
jgi:hypothetical protein